MNTSTQTPLGRMYEVDGRNLFLHRAGTGGPAAANPDRASTQAALENLMYSHTGESSPAWRRLVTLVS
jgi:hypothetical protein